MVPKRKPRAIKVYTHFASLKQILLGTWVRLSAERKNAIGAVEQPVQLNITTAPALKASLKDMDVLRGQDAVLLIDIQGYPAPEIIWSRGDQVLESVPEKISFSDDRKQLTLHNVQIEHEDEYHVRVVNEFGEVTSKSKLSVLGKLTPRALGTFISINFLLRMFRASRNCTAVGR